MSEGSERLAVRGQVLRFVADPFAVGADAAIEHIADGVVILRDGRVEAVGAAGDLLPTLTAEDAVHNYGDGLVMAGFVDTHVHYPQTEVIASHGAQLIEWLETYTYPAEAKYDDAAYARAAADLFVAERLRGGVTTAGVYCTTHPESVDAFFEACAPFDLRMIAGKMLMDRNAPDAVLDDAEAGYRDSKVLIDRWHGRGRALYALTPRFAPTSTPAQLEATGALWREHPDVFLQTHIAESRDELEWVAKLFPDATDYLAVYERYGLLGPRAVFGHGIYLSEREADAIAAADAAIAHCPTSNLFIGSGLFDLRGMYARPMPPRIGLATDVGGGSSLSMFATMRTAYEVAQLRGASLHPVEAFYLATWGGARALHLDDRIGTVAPGFEADLAVIDLRSTPLIRYRMSHAREIAEALFVQMILADDRAVRATYANGNRVYDRDAGYEP